MRACVWGLKFNFIIYASSRHQYPLSWLLFPSFMVEKRFFQFLPFDLSLVSFKFYLPFCTFSIRVSMRAQRKTGRGETVSSGIKMDLKKGTVKQDLAQLTRVTLHAFNWFVDCLFKS